MCSANPKTEFINNPFEELTWESNILSQNANQSTTRTTAVGYRIRNTGLPLNTFRTCPNKTLLTFWLMGRGEKPLLFLTLVLLVQHCPGLMSSHVCCCCLESESVEDGQRGRMTERGRLQ